jgi:hypothetical protein
MTEPTKIYQFECIDHHKKFLVSNPVKYDYCKAKHDSENRYNQNIVETGYMEIRTDFILTHNVQVRRDMNFHKGYRKSNKHGHFGNLVDLHPIIDKYIKLRQLSKKNLLVLQHRDSIFSNLHLDLKRYITDIVYTPNLYRFIFYRHNSFANCMHIDCLLRYNVEKPGMICDPLKYEIIFEIFEGNIIIAQTDQSLLMARKYINDKGIYSSCYEYLCELIFDKI